VDVHIAWDRHSSHRVGARGSGMDLFRVASRWLLNGL